MENLDKQFNTAMDLDNYRDIRNEKILTWYYRHDIENKPAFMNENFKQPIIKEYNNRVQKVT